MIQLAGVPFRIVEYQHTQLGRGGAVVRTKLRNLLDGSVQSRSFKGNDKVEPARVDKVNMQYLYQDGFNLVLMDLQTYEQMQLEKQLAGSQADFLAEGSEVVALVFNNRVIGIELPAKLALKVAHTEPGSQGDTAKAALKPATLESGAIIKVPLFINTDDVVIVDTRTSSYVERAK